MAAAIRVVTVQRGIDPRDFALVGFGGAGPMHVSRVGRRVRHRAPWSCPGRRASRRRSGWCAPTSAPSTASPFPADLDALDPVALDAAFARRSRSGHATRSAPRHDGDIEVHRCAAMRVHGQVHALEVPLPDGAARRRDRGDAPGRSPSATSPRTAWPRAPSLQLTALRVRVVRRDPSAAVRARRDGPAFRAASPNRSTHAAAYFAELRRLRRPHSVFDWSSLAPGDRDRGPRHRPGAGHDGGGAARAGRRRRP